jgi:phosphoribosylaminoimidazole-succinocarboxamide synthase
MTVVMPVEYPVPNRTPAYFGKVREVYDLGDKLLIVATDRISTYDVILPNRIPGKGRLLTRLSEYWFDYLRAAVKTHFLSSRRVEFPEGFRDASALEGRSMLVHKARRLDVECIVRGYLAGSGLKEYRRHGTVCGLRLPPGIPAYAPLPEPIFTPSTKASVGHDENITYEAMERIVGAATAAELRATSLEVYARAAEHARSRGVIIADTKFEFGIHDGKLMLIDEVLTPDSSRFWDMQKHVPGHEPEPIDKQYVRNAVDATGWDHSPPAPRLSPEVIAEAQRRYKMAVERITGQPVHESGEVHP